MLIVNPGAHIGEHPRGWTNTEAGARAKAEQWLANLRADAITDVELLPDARPSTDSGGRWVFTFRHTITGVTVELETDGIDDMDAYLRQCIFLPKVYWNGSSVGEPKLEDWAADGYTPVKTYLPPLGERREEWAVEYIHPDGPNTYQVQHDQKIAEMTADAVATYLASVAAGETRQHGPDTDAVNLAVRDLTVYADGSEYRTAWRTVRPGVPDTGGEERSG